jgi:hypothetical protein
MLREQLVGTWRLISRETRRSDGSVSHAYGEHPIGQLMYDAAGNMSVAFMRPGRSKFVHADKFQGTAAEIKAAFDGFQGYFGIYEIDEDKKTVTHQVEGSLLPNWEGTSQTRFVEISGNRLTLSTPPTVDGGATQAAVLVWERKA